MSFAAVMGPMAYVQHLLSGQRLPFTAAYFGSVALTLFFSMGVSFPPVAVNRVCRACCYFRSVADTSSLPAPTASQHDPHHAFRYHPARSLVMVPRQLLSNGNKQLAYGYIFWRSESRDVDVGVMWITAVHFSEKPVTDNTRHKLAHGKMVFWLTKIDLSTVRLKPGPIHCEREAYGTCIFRETGKPGLGYGSKIGEHTRGGHLIWSRKYYKGGGVIEVTHDDHQDVPISIPFPHFRTTDARHGCGALISHGWLAGINGWRRARLSRKYAPHGTLARPPDETLPLQALQHAIITHIKVQRRCYFLWWWAGCGELFIYT